MSIVSRKIRRVKLSPSVAARIVIAERLAKGLQIMDLTLGEPDFPTPEHICEAAHEAIRRGDTKYPPAQGKMSLREAVANKFKRELGVDYPVKQIIVGTGAKQVIFNALAASLEGRNEVIVPAPYWVSYPDMVLAAGGVPVLVRNSAETGFKLTAEALERAITPRTKWLILNSPNNPTGAVYSRQELAGIADVLRRHPSVWILTDDIYTELNFTGEKRVPHILDVAPDLVNRTLVVNGVSKAYAMTGWRVGFGAGPKELLQAMAVIQSQSTSGATSISQAAALAALTGPQDCVARFARIYQQRRDLALGELAGVSGLRIVKPMGAFYLFPDCSGLLGRKTPEGQVIATDADLVQYLLTSRGVALIDGAAYGGSGAFRLSFAAAENDIRSGCAAIREACGALSS